MDSARLEMLPMNRALTFCAALFLSPLAACDSPDDIDVEIREQLYDAEIALDDALVDLEGSELVIVDATFELGMDAGSFTVEAITEGGELVVYEIDAMTRERVEAERRPARRDRVELARRVHHLRHRLARIVRELRIEHRDHRPARARLLDDGDVEVELLDRRGNRRVLRRRLAEGRSR